MTIRVASGPTGTFQAESDVASGGDLVVAAYMDQRMPSVTGAVNASTIRVVVSRNGGQTFGAPFAVDGSRAVDQFDPAVALLPGGRTYIGWFEDDGRGTRHVRVAAADDPEGPYRTAMPLDDGLESVDRPWIAARDNLVLAAWVSAPSHRIYVARSHDAGATFSAPVASAAGGLMLGCLAASGDGAFWMVANAYEGAFAAQPRILAARSDDGGASFAEPVSLGVLTRPGRTIPRCAATSTGIVAGWADRLGPDDLMSPSLMDADLWLAWADAGGSQPAARLPAPPGTIPVAFPPALAATEDAWVLFYARAAEGTMHDHGWRAFAVTARPTETPGAPIPISPEPAPGIRVLSLSPPGVEARRWLGDTAALTIVRGTAIAVFAENRSGDADLYAARLEACSAPSAMSR